MGLHCLRGLWENSTVRATVAAAAAVVVAAKVFTAVRASRRAAAVRARLANSVPNVVYLYSGPRLPGYIHGGYPAMTAEAFLRLARIPYKYIPTQNFEESPTGRLPYIELNGKQTADSHFLVQRLKEVYPEEVAKNLAPLEGDAAATFTLLQRTLTYPCRLAFYRLFVVDHPEEALKKYGPMFQSKYIPAFVLNRFLASHRQGLIDMLNKEGFGDLTDEQYRGELRRDLDAIAHQLTKTGGFAVTKDRPSEADAVLFASLYQMHKLQLPEFDVVRTGVMDAYVKKMTALLYPDEQELTSNKEVSYKVESHVF